MIIPLQFIEAPVFTRLLPRYLSDDEYRDEAADLTAKERRLLKAALEEEKQQRARLRAMRRK
jgi:hypothetical protein